MGEVNHGHFSLSWTYYVNWNKQRYEFKPSKLNYRRGDYLKIKEYLNRIDWISLFGDKDISEIYSIFVDTCLSKARIPEFRVNRHRLKKPWLNKEI